MLKAYHTCMEAASLVMLLTLPKHLKNLVIDSSSGGSSFISSLAEFPMSTAEPCPSSHFMNAMSGVSEPP